MKSPLLYLTAVKLKNQLLEVVKSPAKLLYGVLLIALFVISGFSGTGLQGGQLRDPRELTAIMTLFYAMMFLLVFASGSSSSNSPMFTLSDVTLLFPAPLSSNKVLVYGLVRQLGLSLVMGFFLLFQYSWLHRAYGVEPWGLALVVAGYALTLFVAQVAAMASYVRTSGNETAAKVVRWCVFGLALLFALWGAFTCRGELLSLSQGSGFEPLVAAGAAFFGEMPGTLFPVAGWAAGLVGAALAGDWASCGLFGGLLCALFAVLLGLILTCRNNYYEDVLQTAETAQSAITAQKEGQLSEVVPKHVKVGKVGLGKGWGASAIYYKHRVENRRSGVFFLSNLDLIFDAILVFCAVLMMEDTGLVGIVAMSTYLQMFTVALGRFNRELAKPYLYLMPEPPLKKLLYALKESLLSSCLEAVFLFLVIGLITKWSPVAMAFCALARISYALLFTAGNVLVERVFGMVRSKALVFLFYFIALLVMAGPGWAAALAGAVLLPALGVAGSLLALSAVNAAVAVLVLWLCRNMLQYAELNGR